ncbi:MAG: glycosyltransferase family 39 protein [Gemmatimonadota bacterium]
MSAAPRVLWWALVAAVLTLTVSLRVNLGRPLTTDEASYARAAEQGFLANWLDAPGLRKMRHEHPPLVTFLQMASLEVLGRDEVALRAPSVVFGALTVLVLMAGFRWAAPEVPAWTAALAAILLAVYPAHVYASQWGSWHAALVLVFAATALAAVRAFRRLETGTLLVAFAGVALGFAVMEYALLLLATLLVALALRPNPWLWIARGPRVQVTRPVRLGLALIPLVVGVTWLAGILKLSLVRNLVHYLGYLEHPVYWRGATVPDAPPIAYVDWYVQQMPAYLGLFMLETVAVVALVASRRWDVTHTSFPAVALFGIALGALLVGHVLDTVYTVYFGLAALLLLPFLIAEALAAARRARRVFALRGVTIAAVTGTAAVALPTVPYAATVAIPGATGYREAAETLLEATEAARGERPRVLAFYSPIVEWYDPRLDVDRYPRGDLPPELLERLASGEYEYVLFHSAQVQRWPGDPGLAWARAHARLVLHRADRWGELWLYRVADPAPGRPVVVDGGDGTRPGGPKPKAREP